MDRTEYKNKIEAILFVSGNPVKYKKIAEILELDIIMLKSLVHDLADEYKNRGINLLMFDDECQFCTSEVCNTVVKEALGMVKTISLSNSALEVAAIIAYHQPITRAYIEQIRGVDSSYAINILIERNLIESKGKLDVPGKPNIYGTTDNFLCCFGINSIEELPKLE